MLPNNHPFLDTRLEALQRAVKRVYASTFSSHAKAYIRATPYRLEEEKMAVLIQPILGATREGASTRTSRGWRGHTTSIRLPH